MAITDQIWREDIVDQQEVSRDSAKILNDYVKRAVYQGAPATLVKKLEHIRDLNAQVCDELEEIRTCFPEQPE